MSSLLKEVDKTNRSNYSNQPDGGGEQFFESSNCVPKEEIARINKEIAENKSYLKSIGKWPRLQKKLVLFEWPLRQAEGFNFNSYYAISNYVDQDPTSGILDYNCGARTYDGHNGIDISTWPFGWHMVNDSQVAIIAGSDGIIIAKDDGHPDDSCDFASKPANFVVLSHSDGSRSLYYHMKTGSVTTKPIGASVTQGEYLGVVASSGISTGPHLHFEVRDANNNVIEPFAGACNAKVNGTTTWWADQLPYRDPTINYLRTYSTPPVFNTCPDPATIDEQNVFSPGDDVRFTAFFHDQDSVQVATYTIKKPDGSVLLHHSGIGPEQ